MDLDEDLSDARTGHRHIGDVHASAADESSRAHRIRGAVDAAER
jgi:hypothetical protein